MTNIFPIARSKRAKSLRQILSLHPNEEFIMQNKLAGESCHIIVSDGRVSILNRIGFNITPKLKRKKYFQDILSISSKYEKLHALCIVRDECIVLHDILKIENQELFNTTAFDRMKMLNSLNIFSSSVLCIDSYDSLPDLKNHDPGVFEVICKLKSSTYPKRSKRSKEPIADWYTLSFNLKNLRDVIVDSYHTGASREDIVFRCMQNRKGKLVNVGKIRIEDKKIREKFIRLLKNKKRIICEVCVNTVPGQKHIKNLTFSKQISAKPFSSVVVDAERDLLSVEVIHVHTKKVESFKSQY